MTDILLCMPVQDGFDWTVRALKAVDSSVNGSDRVSVLVFDNLSTEPVPKSLESGWVHIDVSVERAPYNWGYYAPLRYAYMKALADGIPFVGLMHNDLLIYERGWDRRMVEAFDDLKLGLVGLCGSNEADAAGGRGAGTMCHFRGTPGLGQSQDAGRRIHGLEPAILLDSLFMLFRTPTIGALQEDWNNLPLAHFYDKIWPLKLAQVGWRTAVLGIECDHAGGITLVANQGYTDSCKNWFDSRPEEASHIPTGAHEGDGSINWNTAMYLMAEQRLLSVYRDREKLIPCRIDHDYRIHK